MPSDWSRSWEVDRLVAGQLSFECEIPLAQMPRLQDRLFDQAQAERTARATLNFGKAHGADVARVAVSAQVPLRCERCMGRCEWPVAAEATLALVAALAAADRVPGGFEPVLAEGGRVRLLDLVEEELLLALPLIARHASAMDCRAIESDARSDADVTQKPFSQLRELLDRR